MCKNELTLGICFYFLGIECCQPSAVYHCHSNWSRDQSLWRKLFSMYNHEDFKNSKQDHHPWTSIKQNMINDME